MAVDAFCSNGGFYIAFVMRVCSSASEKVECKLTFLGLLVLENQLKPETEPVIRALHAAKIRTIMVTGALFQVFFQWNVTVYMQSFLADDVASVLGNCCQ